MKYWWNVNVFLALIYGSKNNFTDRFPVANIMWFQCCKLDVLNLCIENWLGSKFLNTIEKYELKHWRNVYVILALINENKNNFKYWFHVANIILFQFCKLNVLNLCIDKILGFKYLKSIVIYEWKHWRNVNVFLALIYGSKNNFIDWFPVANMMLFQCCKLNVLNQYNERRLTLKYLKTIYISALKHWRNVDVFLALKYGCKNNFIDWFIVANIMLFQCCKLNILNLCIEKRLGFKFINKIYVYKMRHCRNVDVFLALMYGRKNNFIDWFPVVNMTLFQCCKLNLLNLCFEKRLRFQFLKSIDIWIETLKKCLCFFSIDTWK